MRFKFKPGGAGSVAPAFGVGALARHASHRVVLSSFFRLPLPQYRAALCRLSLAKSASDQNLKRTPEITCTAGSGTSLLRIQRCSVRRSTPNSRAASEMEYVRILMMPHGVTFVSHNLKRVRSPPQCVAETMAKPIVIPSLRETFASIRSVEGLFFGH